MRPTTESALLACAVALAGCSTTSSDSSADEPCVAVPDAGCAATYAPPAFDTIFTNIFQPNCSVGTGTCHTSDFAAGGLVFASESASYALLLGADGGTPYVLADNASCSTLMKRLESSDPSYHMPRGNNSLSAGDLCTITQWIDQGAPP